MLNAAFYVAIPYCNKSYSVSCQILPCAHLQAFPHNL